jgi:hypothetical protein
MATSYRANQDSFKPKIIPITSKTVRYASITRDNGGYPFVWILFDDGSDIKIEETQQVGDIKATISG